MNRITYGREVPEEEITHDDNLSRERWNGDLKDIMEILSRSENSTKEYD